MRSTDSARSRNGRASRRSINTVAAAMRRASTAVQKPGGIPKMLKPRPPLAMTASRSPLASPISISTAPGHIQENARKGTREQFGGGINMHADVALAERRAIALAHELGDGRLVPFPAPAP